MSQWKNIYENLKNQGIEVYSPGQHQGECKFPYVVVKSSGLTPLSGFSSAQALYDLMCYVPENRYSILEDYVNQVKEAMKLLYPAIIPLNSETESFLDSTVKGHMISVQYENNRKLRR